MEHSRINLTGKNFLIALSIALAATVILAFIYMLMGSIVAGSAGTFNSVSVFEYISKSFYLFFKTIGICIAPIVFLIAFALLQRFRIKD